MKMFFALVLMSLSWGVFSQRGGEGTFTREGGGRVIVVFSRHSLYGISKSDERYMNRLIKELKDTGEVSAVLVNSIGMDSEEGVYAKKVCVEFVTKSAKSRFSEAFAYQIALDIYKRTSFHDADSCADIYEQ